MNEVKRKRVSYLRRRNRSKGIAGKNADKLRLCIYRSNRHIEAQIIDDKDGKTVASAGTNNKSIKAEIASANSKVECAGIVGKALAKQAIKKKISKVVFDRNGFPYHGRVKALAEGVREGGLNF